MRAVLRASGHSGAEPPAQEAVAMPRWYFFRGKILAESLKRGSVRITQLYTRRVLLAHAGMNRLAAIFLFDMALVF